MLYIYFIIKDICIFLLIFLFFKWITVFITVSALFKKRRQQVTRDASTSEEVQKSYYTRFQNVGRRSHQHVARNYSFTKKNI